MSVPDDLRAAVRETVAGVMGGLAGELGDDDPLLERGLDSVAMVELLAGLEERFSLSIPPGEISPENFRDVRSLEALVARLKARC